ncbi:MAG: RluA family pseudouridine synthase [Tidjanibacter sp.]|nr:RluA family pseudouridine synthase [Tidjanibacter sp.]
MEYIVDKDNELLKFLFEKMADKSRTTVKSFLTHGQVSVNGCVSTQFNFPLQAGDRVEVTRQRQKDVFHHPMMRIVYEDEYIVVIDKRNGLLSIATDKEPQKNAYYILSQYLKRQDARNKIFVIHRLDRETSGLMMFAKNEEVKRIMQENWLTQVLDRRYAAVVEGVMPTEEGKIETWLVEDANHKVWVSRDENGKKAVTHYSVIKAGKEYSLVDLKLDTGRKNQIRAHLEWMKCSIAGDKKYGAKSNPLGRVALHAYKLDIKHPVTGQRHVFITRIPQNFEETVK